MRYVLPFALATLMLASLGSATAVLLWRSLGRWALWGGCALATLILAGILWPQVFNEPAYQDRRAETAVITAVVLLGMSLGPTVAVDRAGRVPALTFRQHWTRGVLGYYAGLLAGFVGSLLTIALFRLVFVAL